MTAAAARSAGSCWCATTRATSARRISTNRPDITYAPEGARTGSGGTTNLLFDTQGRRVPLGVVEPGGNGAQLCRRRHAVGHLADLRRDRSRRPWLGLRRRAARRRHDAARRHGPLLARSADGRSQHRHLYETEDAGDSGFYRSCRTIAPGPSRAAGSTCSRSATSQPRSRRRAGRSERAGTCAGFASAIRWRRQRVLLRAGRGQGRRAIQPARRRLVGRATKATSSPPMAACVGEGQVFEYDPRDETLTVIYDAPNADRPRQSGQHHGDAARRSPAL